MPVDEPQPFGAYDYRIDFLPPEAPREVMISALDALPLQVGDDYTISRADGFHDLVVEEVSRAKGGRWNARCRVSSPTLL